MDHSIEEQTDRALQAKTLFDKEKVSAALRELADEHRGVPRSDTARLREVLDDVEDALSAGASHSAVLDTLHNQGFSLTLSSFQSTLARLRRERRVA
jgi:molecular chaperone GrpE (heat shock protein)